MSRGRKAESSPEWMRVQAVMRVQAGEIGVTEACRQLGISRPHYYEMETRVLGAALGAASARKPGPREKRENNGETEDLTERLRQAQREREILDLKVKHLEDVNEALRKKAEDEKGKKPSRPGRSRASRVPLLGRLQTEGSRPGEGAAGRGDAGAPRLPPTGDPSGHVLRVAKGGSDGAENSGGAGPGAGADPGHDR